MIHRKERSVKRVLRIPIELETRFIDDGLGARKKAVTASDELACRGCYSIKQTYLTSDYVWHLLPRSYYCGDCLVKAACEQAVTP